MSNETYQGATSRLEEILEEVSREDISLDDALVLYEEAVKLSLAACDLSESDLNLASADDLSATEDASASMGEDAGSAEVVSEEDSPAAEVFAVTAESADANAAEAAASEQSAPATSAPDAFSPAFQRAGSQDSQLR